MKKIRGSVFVELSEAFTAEQEDSFVETMSDVLNVNGFSMTSQVHFIEHIDEEHGEYGEDLLEFNFTMKTRKRFIESERFELDEAISAGLLDAGFEFFETKYELD